MLLWSRPPGGRDAGRREPGRREGAEPSHLFRNATRLWERERGAQRRVERGMQKQVKGISDRRPLSRAPTHRLSRKAGETKDGTKKRPHLLARPPSHDVGSILRSRLPGGGQRLGAGGVTGLASRGSGLLLVRARGTYRFTRVCGEDHRRNRHALKGCMPHGQEDDQSLLGGRR